MKTIYQRTITHIGAFVQESLEDKFFILFNSNAPEEYREYCILHQGSQLNQKIKTGDKLVIGTNEYLITSVGDVVNKNLHDLGHITIKFDGATVPEQPGTLHIENTIIKNITCNNDIKIISL